MGRFEAPNGHSFWLVQEICNYPSNPTTWNFMDTLSVIPMPATEFQGGRLDRDAADLRWSSDVFIIGGLALNAGDVRRTVFFVAPSRSLSSVMDDFEQWLCDPAEVYHQTKVSTWFGHAFLNKQHLHGVKAADSGPYNGRVVAWWSLEDQVFWTLDAMIARHICSWLNGEEMTEG